MNIASRTYTKLALLFVLSNISLQAISLSSLFWATPSTQPPTQENIPAYTPKYAHCEVAGMAGTCPAKICSFIQQTKKISENIKNGIPATENNRANNVLILEGPTGVGKTRLAKAMAQEAGCHFFEIYGADIPSKFVGGSKDYINEQMAIAKAEGKAREQVVMVFIDEIDALSCNEKSTAYAEYNGASMTLRHHLDLENDNPEIIFVFATSRLDKIPVQLLDRPGSRIVSIPKPDAEQRKKLLQYFSKIYAGKELAEYCSNDCLEQLIKEMENFSVRNVEDLLSDTSDYASDDGEPVALKHLMYALSVIKVNIERANTFRYIQQRS